MRICASTEIALLDIYMSYVVSTALHAFPCVYMCISRNCFAAHHKKSNAAQDVFDFYASDDGSRDGMDDDGTWFDNEMPSSAAVGAWLGTEHCEATASEQDMFDDTDVEELRQRIFDDASFSPVPCPGGSYAAALDLASDEADMDDAVPPPPPPPPSTDGENQRLPRRVGGKCKLRLLPSSSQCSHGPGEDCSDKRRRLAFPASCHPAAPKDSTPTSRKRKAPPPVLPRLRLWK